jgi:hypothetical protein
VASAAATSAITSSVAGLTTSMVVPDAEARHSLLISSRFGSIAVVAIRGRSVIGL